MWIELPPVWIAAINCLGIPAAHLLVSWWVSNMPASRFDPAAFCFRTRPWERNGKTYRTLFRVRRWKDLLPDAATWFNGFAKGRLESTDRDYLQTFSRETCRGEFAHWLQIPAIFLFILWTPWPYSPVIILYGLLSNLPCIINLRLTRIRIRRISSLRQASPQPTARPH